MHCPWNYTEILREADKHPNANCETTLTGENAVNLAVRNRYPVEPFVTYLVVKRSCDVNHKDKSGVWPLFKAIRDKYPASYVKQLIELGSQTDSCLRIALDHPKSTEVVKMLLA